MLDVFALLRLHLVLEPFVVLLGLLGDLLEELLDVDGVAVQGL
jgi:hypothetical protein